MRFRGFFYLQLIVVSCANNVDCVIRDYFLFKGITRLVGFSCGDSENDYQLVRSSNDVGIAVSVKKLESSIDVSRFLHSIYHSLGVFLDLRCPFADNHVAKLFNEASMRYMFDHLHQWLIVAKDLHDTVQLINDSAFSIATDMVIAVQEDRDYDLYDTYNHCKPCGGSLNVTKFGNWSKDAGLRIELLAGKFSRRWNYNGMKVKVAGFITGKPKDQALIEYLQQQDSLLIDNWSKFGYSLMVHIAEMFNLTFQLIEINRWTEHDPNVGPLIIGLGKRIFDLGYFPSIITNERLDYADVITQVWPVRTCFMFLTVPSSKMDINIIFRPFSRNVWYMVVLLTVIIIFTLWMILQVEKDNNNSDQGTTVLIIVAALCQQGLPSVSTQCAGRVAFLHTMIFGLLVYNYYSAAIVSARLNAPSGKMNDSLYSLVHSKMKLAAYKDVYFNFLLQSPLAEIQYFKRHWDAIPDDKKFRSIEEGVKRIMKPGFAYHANPDNVYPLIKRMFSKQMICQLTEVHLFRLHSIGLWSAQYGQFREITKIGLIRMSTSGIRKRQVLRWTSSKPYCDKDKRYVSSVTIHEITPMVLLLLIGMLLSVTICIVENAISRKLQPKQKKIESKRILEQIRKKYSDSRKEVEKAIKRKRFL